MQQNPIQTTGKKTVVLNIGCGTDDALVKRPPLEQLAQCCAALYERSPFALHLSGAPFERDVNQQFVALLKEKLQATGHQTTIVDWAGKLSLDQLSGLLQQADLVISSDSGPYHMAVALGVGTLCWFNFATPPSYHHHPDVVCLVEPSAAAFAAGAQRLLSCNSGE